MPRSPESIRGRLRYLRDDVLRCSTAELALRLEGMGVRNATLAGVSRYERHDPLPRCDYLAAIAELAGVTADWILFGEDSNYTGNELTAADREMLATLAESAMDHPGRCHELIRAMLRILRGGGGAVPRTP